MKGIDRDFGGKSNRIYYLATQPSYFSSIVEKLSSAHLIYGPQESHWCRVMVEKPFGRDLASALDLQEKLIKYLDDRQIYRVDHYLGKEGVQNLLALRLNHNLEPHWNQRHIEHVQINFSEEIGIGTRAKLWEETGLIRDVVQNHIMQLLSLFAMDMGENIPEQKLKVLESIRPVENFVRGQYGPGIIHGEAVPGYSQEKDVSESSDAETFAALRLWIENDRWKGVPFDIRAGKRLASQNVEIIVSFKSKEKLHIRIQPKPEIVFEKQEPIAFQSFPYSEAYQKIIYDCIQGDRSSFVQKEEQLAAWRILAPALESKDLSIPYTAGTAGPNFQ